MSAGCRLYFPSGNTPIGCPLRLARSIPIRTDWGQDWGQLSCSASLTSVGVSVAATLRPRVRVPTLRPMLASAATQLAKGAGWSYEVKFDGYRTLAVKNGAQVKLLSRNLKDATRLYPTVVREIARLQAESVLLDGEVVAIDDQGQPSFQALHHQSAHTLVYCCISRDQLERAVASEQQATCSAVLTRRPS